MLDKIVSAVIIAVSLVAIVCFWMLGFMILVAFTAKLGFTGFMLALFLIFFIFCLLLN